jgi:hypothetical protein
MNITSSFLFTSKHFSLSVQKVTEKVMPSCKLLIVAIHKTVLTSCKTFPYMCDVRKLMVLVNFLHIRYYYYYNLLRKIPSIQSRLQNHPTDIEPVTYKLTKIHMLKKASIGQINNKTNIYPPILHTAKS